MYIYFCSLTLNGRIVQTCFKMGCASQQEDPWFSSWLGPFCVEFARSTLGMRGFSLGAPAFSQYPKTMPFWLIDDYKINPRFVVSVSLHSCLSCLSLGTLPLSV